jgi:predicted nucleic acid-binding protein
MRSLDITVDDESFGDVHRLAVEHGLSGYGAAYLELAIRKGLPLATAEPQASNYSSKRETVSCRCAS